MRAILRSYRCLALLLAIVGCVAVSLARPMIARAEDVLEVVAVGWDSTVVPGTWSPIRVKVTGGSASADARVEVELSGLSQTGPQATPVAYPVGTYAEDLALPAGVTKEVTLWVPVDGNAKGMVRLSVAGHTLAEKSIGLATGRTPAWPLIGVLADSPAISRSVGQIELPYQGLPLPPSVARIAPTDLPSQGDRLAALSALVVQGNAATTLTDEQRHALRDWVAAGGHLVLLGGPDLARAAAILPADAPRVTVAGSDTADLAPLARWAGISPVPALSGPVARFQVSAGASLVGPADQSLAWRVGLGRGTVTLLAADPSLEPLASWSGTPSLLRKVLEPALPDATQNEKLQALAQQRENPLQIESAVEALPPGVYPDWRIVAAILAGFAVLAGPLLALAMGRLDRRGWVWLVVPGLGLLLAGGLYGVGVAWSGRDVLENVVSAVTIQPGGPARQELVAGFYAPTHPALTVSAPADAAIRVSAPGIGLVYGPYGPQQPPTTESPFVVVGGRDTRVELRTGQWGMRSVALSRSLDGAAVGQVTAHLGLDGGLIEGTVRNDTPYFLEDAAIAIDQSLVRIGNLAPGQSAPVVFDPASAQSSTPRGNGPSLSTQLFGRTPEQAPDGGGTTPTPAPAVLVGRVAVASSQYVAVAPPFYPSGPPALVVPPDPEVQRRVRLMDAVLNARQQAAFRFGPGPAALPPTFFAFTRAPVGPDLPRAGDHPFRELTFIQQPLVLEFAPGPFRVPPELIPAEILGVQAYRGIGSGGNGTLRWVEVQEGSITYGFHPPLPARAQVQALVVGTRQVGPAVPIADGGPPVAPNATAGPADPGVFAIYNWSRADWDELPGGQEQARLEPAGVYVGPDGLVQVRVTAARDHLVRFVAPELSVEGRAE